MQLKPGLGFRVEAYHKRMTSKLHAVTTPGPSGIRREFSDKQPTLKTKAYKSKSLNLAIETSCGRRKGSWFSASAGSELRIWSYQDLGLIGL